MARELRLNIVEDRKGDALKSAAADAELAAKGLDSMGDQAEQAKRRMESLDREIAKHKALVHALGAEYVDSGNKSTLAALRQERAVVSNLTKIRSEFEAADKDIAHRSESAAKRVVQLSETVARDLEQEAKRAAPLVTKSFSDAFSEVPVVGAHPLIAGLGAAIIAAGPYLSGLVGGAIGAAIGGGAIAVGVLGAVHDPKVKAAFQDFGSLAKNEFQDATASFQEPLRQAATVFTQSLEKDMPAIKATFTELSRSVVPLAQGVAGFVDKLLPGIEKAVHNAEPIIALISKELPQVGDALGHFADYVTTSKGDLEALSLTFSAVETQFEGLGRAIQFGGDAFHAFNVGMKDTLDTVSKFPIGGQLVAPLDNLVRKWLGNVDNLKAPLDQLIAAATSTGNSFVSAEDKYNHFLGVVLGSRQAADATAQAVLSLKDAFQANGRAVDGNSQAAINNRGAILNAVQAAEQQREAMIASGQSAAYANSVYNQTISQLYAIGKAAGLTKAQLDQLIGVYTITIEQTTVMRTIDLTGASTDRPTGLGNVRGFRAAGGPVDVSGAYVVGEQGPEIVALPAGAKVYSNASSRAMLGARSGYGFTPIPAGSGGAQRVEVVLTGGDAATDAFLSVLRKAVNNRGGNVQTAIMGRAA